MPADPPGEARRPAHTFAAREGVAQRLRATEVFSSLTASDALVLADFVEHLVAPAGHTLIHQGEAGDDLYLIDDGTAEVRVRGPAGRPVVVGTRGPGDVIGEIGLLTGGVRTADVVAVTDLRLLKLSREAYLRYVGHATDVQQRLVRNVATRSSETAQRILSDRAREAGTAPFDLILGRLIQHEIDSMRAGELRGETPSFDDVFAFYGATRFLYPGKLEELEPRLSAVRDTWGKLLAANNQVFKILLRSRAEAERIVPKSSVCAFEYTPGTWQAQHLVSIDRHEFTGTLAVVIGILAWCDANPDVRHFRLTYRPENAGIRRLFNGCADAIPTAHRALTVRDYVLSPLDALGSAALPVDPTVRVHRASQADAGRVRDFYAQHLHPVELASLFPEDVGLIAFGQKMLAFGLERERGIFLAEIDGELVGAVICNSASEGINFSFLENAFEALEIDPRLPTELRAATFVALVRNAVGYYAERNRTHIVGLVNPAYADLRRAIGLVSREPKQYAALTFDRGEAAFTRAQQWSVGYYRTHLIDLAGQAT